MDMLTLSKNRKKVEEMETKEQLWRERSGELVMYVTAQQVNARNKQAETQQ